MGIAVYLIVCPLVFLAGLVDAIGGGGGLISLPAYLLAGIPPHYAIATNKFSSSAGTLISTVRYCRHGCVDWITAIPGMAAAIAGAQIGARLSLTASDEFLKIVMLFLLPVIAVYVLFRKELERPEGADAMPRGKQIALIVSLTLLLGLYDGFYGPGTGTFLLLIYTGLCGMPLRNASGNMKLANLGSNLSSLAVFLINGVVLLPLGLTAAVFSIAGHYIGAGLAMKNGNRLIRIVILTVIALLFAKMLTELITG